MRWTSRILLLTALLLGPVGCVEPATDLETFLAAGRPIFYGSVDTDPDHMAVVALTIGSQYFCSGTLIASNVVLTAAHCIQGMEASNTEIFFGQNSNSGVGDYVEVSEWKAHLTYLLSGGTEGDIAIIRLASPAPAAITPIPYLPAGVGLTPADAGETVTFAGFGLTETGSDGVKMQVGGTIDNVCPGPDACGAGGYIAPKAFDYLQSGGGPCSGDSGGPAFVVRNSTEYVAGVTSYGDQDCTLYGVSTTVSEYASWIETFLAGGSNEDCTNGVDDDSDGAADCDDSDCVLHAACLPPNACNAPLPISCGDTVNGTTAGAYSVFGQNGCATSTWSGPEVIYELDAGQGASVIAQLTMGGSGDLDLFVFAENGGSCDLASCIDASLELGSAPETVSFSMPATARYLMVDTWDTASAYTLSVGCADDAPVESCTNGRDDDGDGAADCADADCVTTPFCRDDVELCNNAVDDDGDSLVDCDDSDCADYPGCPAEICDNRVDDDGDGDIDCADLNCFAACDKGHGSSGSGEEGGCNSAGRGAGPWQAALALALLVVLTRSRRRGRG